ncbi:MAG TPA: CRISPR-associated ring nuclease [Burkholderiaceae bacterium]|nr:CRISPR-associated ring nuclease [Burkholderiaceae bacterium]
MNLLVCTLGASWAVVPEVFGFLAPALLDLYAHHPQREALAALRAQHTLAAPDELWIVTTEGEQTAASLARLRTWWRQLGAPLPLRVWSAAGTDQLATQAECDHIRELTLRVVMCAAERCRDGQLVLSLAGGRKTMSADLQSAGAIFGAQAWLHVVGPEPLPEPLRKALDTQLFAHPLPAGLAGAVTPLLVGRGSRNELLDIQLDGRRVDSTAFPLALAEPALSWPLPADGATLAAEIDRRLREGSRLFGNFLGALARAQQRENFRSLYRLPPARIDELRRTPLSDAHRDWLVRLPKADLHRHFGGVLDLPAQRRVGRAIWDALTASERASALATVRPLLEASDDWPWDWPRLIGTAQRAACAAALLVESADEALARNLYGVTEPRLRLKARRGFEAYERPGELTGSAVLTHPAAIEPYVEAVVAQARAEGLAYVELRGSPHKYRPDDPGGFLRELRTALARAGGGVDRAPRFGFVWILDRRQRDRIPAVIGQAVAAHRELEDFLLGLDLAGDEGTHRPEELACHFAAAFRQCLHITIHAGEGEPADNIWEAAYHLHADRIGHGLTLLDNPRLTQRFRDRGICIELCPTSNREVVGFRDPAVPGSEALPDYPLRGLLEAGLPVTLCTDNPGISRTTLADEFLAAARMGGGLTLWEALGLVREGFVHGFLPAPERARLLARAEQEVFQRTVEFFSERRD